MFRSFSISFSLVSEVVDQQNAQICVVSSIIGIKSIIRRHHFLCHLLWGLISILQLLFRCVYFMGFETDKAPLVQHYWKCSPPECAYRSAFSVVVCFYVYRRICAISAPCSTQCIPRILSRIFSILLPEKNVLIEGSKSDRRCIRGSQTGCIP